MATDARIVVVFRSRLNDGVGEAFASEAERMEALASAMPGFIGYKVFTAEDGERASIIEFESLDAEQAWRDQAEHLKAQQRGRDEFYAAYQLQVCELIRGRGFQRLDA